MFDFIMDDDAQSEGSYASHGLNIPDAMDCMRCGVCLNQCPTYTLQQDEQESPRQRIRTLEKLVIKSESVDDETLVHLNNCTQCRACEAICPSKMDYAELFDQAQHLLSEQKTKGKLASFALQLIADKAQFKKLLPLVQWYPRSGMRWVAQHVGLLHLFKLNTVDQLFRLPAQRSLRPKYTPLTKPVGKVALFTGCISEHFDRQTLNAAIKVMTAMGYEVVVPPEQACCGAIHYHNGEAETAKKLMQQNLDCFNQHQVEAVIYCATGCGSQLAEYKKVLALQDDDAFKPKLFEVMDFIHQHWRDQVRLKPHFGKIAVHEACSQRNVLKNQQAVYAMLQKIPGLRLRELDGNHLCCGAAGSYMLTHPETAQSLCEMKWQQILQKGVDCVVTSNIGCAMHIETGRDPYSLIQIKHPVTLLADQIATK